MPPQGRNSDNVRSRDDVSYGQHQPREHESGMRWQPPTLVLQLRESLAKPLATHAPPAAAGPAGPAFGPCFPAPPNGEG
jgi:hypothetical protein